MESVVIDGTGKHAKVEGYSIGGKSGTSEPTEDKKEEGYVASFIAISPIENTQVVCLVIVYGLTGDNHQGGQVAGPVAAQILSEVLPIMGVTSDGSEPVQKNENNTPSKTRCMDKTMHRFFILFSASLLQTLLPYSNPYSPDVPLHTGTFQAIAPVALDFASSSVVSSLPLLSPDKETFRAAHNYPAATFSYSLLNFLYKIPLVKNHK